MMASEMAVVVGRRLRSRREAQDMSQRAVSEAIKAPNSQIVSDWERGVNQPSERYWPGLEATLGKPRAWYYRPVEADGDESAKAPDLPAALNGGPGPQLDRVEQALADISERLDALGALTIRVALALKLPDEEEDTEAAAQGAEEAAEQPDSQPERSAPASRGRRKAAQAQ